MSPRFLSHRRPGVTFVEVLLFIALLSIIGVVVMPLLFSSTENRLLQETIEIVEGNGVQMLQTLEQEIRDSEFIVDPAPNTSKTLLLLQTGSGVTNPTLFGSASGAFFVVHRDTLITLSSPQVAVKDFHVRNTSVSPTRQSVYISFKLTRTLRLEAPREYTKTFDALITLYPKDILKGNACVCAAPGCEDANTYAWQTYSVVGGVCSCSTKRTSVICQ